jgi:hypothetical protein
MGCMRVIALIAVVALAACSAVASPAPNPPTASPTPATSAEATTTGTPLPTATPTGRIGLATEQYLRLESDPVPFAPIDGRGVTISPDGWHLAYWHIPLGADDTAAELRTIDLVTGTERSLLRAEPDRPGGIAWRSDGSALVVAAQSTQIPFGGIDPPPAYVQVRTVDLATGQVKDLVKLDLVRFYPYAWSARDRVVAGVDAGEGGVHRIFRIREDGTQISGGVIDAGGWQRLDADRTGASLLGVTNSGSAGHIFSTAQIIGTNGPIDLGKRELVDDPYLLGARFRGATSEVVALLRVGGTQMRYALELWPAGLGGQARRVWTSAEAAPYADGDVFVRVDGKVAYVRGISTVPTISTWLRVDLETGASDPLPMGRHRLTGPSFHITDAAIAKLRPQALAPTLTRAAAIAKVRGLQNMIRIDRVDAKLVTWREVANELLWRVNAQVVEANASVWAVGVAGDVRALDGAGGQLRWGVCFVDARTGAVLGFVSDNRADWPWFWEALPDRS